MALRGACLPSVRACQPLSLGRFSCQAGKHPQRHVQSTPSAAGATNPGQLQLIIPSLRKRGSPHRERHDSTLQKGHTLARASSRSLGVQPVVEEGPEVVTGFVKDTATYSQKPAAAEAGKEFERRNPDGSLAARVWVRRGFNHAQGNARREKEESGTENEYGEKGEKKKRRDVFQERYGPLGPEPDAAVRKAIAILSTEKNEAAVQEMLDNLSKTSRGLVVTLFTTLAKERQVEHCLRVSRYILDTPGYNNLERAYNMTLNVLAGIKKLGKAEALFKEMKARGVQPTMVTYNILVSAYARREMVRDSEKLLETMREEGLTPDAYSYSPLLELYSRLGMVEKAEEALQEMLEAEVLPNVFSYTALIGAYARKGDVAKAEATFQGMQQVGCMPDVYAYTAMIDVYAKQGLEKEAERTFKDMVRAGHQPTVVSYTSLLTAYGKGGSVEKAEKIMQAMQEVGCAPNMVTFCSMMETYAGQGQLEDAEAVFEFVKAAGLKPPVQMYTILITAFGKAEVIGKAINYWKMMRKDGCVRDEKAYLSMIELYKKIDRPKRVAKLELEMESGEDAQLMSEDFFEIG